MILVNSCNSDDLCESDYLDKYVNPGDSGESYNFCESTVSKESTDESDYSVDFGESHYDGESDDFGNWYFYGNSAYSDEFGDSGESVYSGESGYFGLSGGSCESYQYGVCRLSDQYGWSCDSGKSRDFGDSGD